MSPSVPLSFPTFHLPPFLPLSLPSLPTPSFPPSLCLSLLPCPSNPPSPPQENPGTINRIKVVRDGGREILTEMRSDRNKDSDSKPSSLPKIPNLRTLQERLLTKLKVKHTNSSQPEKHVTVTTHTATTEERSGRVTQETKTIPSLMPMPLPAGLQNCDIRSKKDAESAISRAKTDECKGLIRNVTCLSQAGRLYHLDIKNSCPIGRNPGRNFEHRPHSWGVGPPAR